MALMCELEGLRVSEIPDLFASLRLLHKDEDVGVRRGVPKAITELVQKNQFLTERQHLAAVFPLLETLLLGEDEEASR